MIYLVEDDANIRELVVYTLNSTGFEAKGFGTPSAFWQALEEQQPELVLLDVMLPEESGLSILEKLRENHQTRKLPIIMLTAKGSEIDKVRGFELGADDYIPKPFGMMELVARVKALLRRTTEDRDESMEEYTIANLYVSPKKHKVKVDGETVHLTRKEFDMLCCLLENKNIVLTRDQLLNRIWGYSFDGESRTVDVHIRTLRQKLGTAGSIIKTVRGIGYKISDED
ncbi:MAG: response regulator transcription factor [Oscillospiraceae bacterium]|nr:response regulator transcription factor [Oscillospiraceae bacterium]